ncbi:helix-turn-helix domain-containing protein [Clostridium tagluense]|uniref:helix-turn-helix domain-containing protein n=1 Tax=Clostridium TaxID=1485 RepID=UPI0013E93F75|nr:MULTISPECIES: cupin domain-containing protein [Clostridium]MBU3129593.1 helix-turn-helix domain-containing protein [Clostridium tagluense]MBZ9624918.1 helix-turn-helix domain-containing protein [Clostridium sp. FP2]MCB2312512.1 helix-turn-helix domain-containing protein [Clostridium tagluense]MCB2317221.1 helix-turn-helix domain-containing protein [Clostridium tagluense]MCB2322085.1 helix-turn-helix domain-containing protein [Clostridium tagluense]
MLTEIAGKIRNLRKEKDLTLKDLSIKTGLSVSFLSQVENGYSSLAITSLKKIAEALNVPMNYFFKPPEIHNFLVKAQEEKAFKIEGSNSEFIRISGDFTGRKIESLIIIIPPEQMHGSKSSHPGEEFVYLLEGALIVNLAGTDYLLKAGDSIQYPSTTDHSWTNPLNQKTKLISIVTPLIF